MIQFKFNSNSIQIQFEILSNLIQLGFELKFYLDYKIQLASNLIKFN